MSNKLISKIAPAFPLFLICVTTLLLQKPVAAFMGRCLLVVNGRTYLDGSCNITMDDDGSFTIGTGTPPAPYFAYVSIVGKGVAYGSWNGTYNGSHAHASLGTLYRDGACWQNKKAKICAWR